MKLTPLEIDCFQEVINMAYGDATGAIAQTMDAFATLHVPQIEVHTLEELKSYIDNKFEISKNFFLTTQVFNGKFSGELLFIIDEHSATNLFNYLNESEVSELEEMKDTVMELTNVLTYSTITNLAKYMKSEVYTMRPSIDIAKGSEIITSGNVQNYSKFIIVSTIMEFQDQDIMGELFILLTEDSYQNLKEALEAFLASLQG